MKIAICFIAFRAKVEKKISKRVLFNGSAAYHMHSFFFYNLFFEKKIIAP